MSLRALPAVSERSAAARNGGGRRSAGAAVGTYLRAQAQQLLVGEDAVRAGTDEGVHDMRVATRRLRSVLRTFRRLFEVGTVNDLRTELKWIAGELGAARDVEVLRARIDKHLDDLPAEQVLGPVRSRLDIRLAAESGDAQRSLLVALDSDRYRDLVSRLVAFVAQPPFTKRASKRAKEVLGSLARREHERLAMLMDVASACGAGPERDEAVHGVRKQAKRARYAAETVQPVFGKAARRYVTAIEGLQELLGERQDAVVAGRLLWEEGRQAGVTPHENGYTFGLLAGREAAMIGLWDDALPDTWRRVNKHKRTGWMS